MMSWIKYLSAFIGQELYLPTLFLYFSPLQILWAKYIETKKYLKMQK